MKLNTKLLKDMISNVNKCKPNNLLEITNYYNIVVSNNLVTLTGTDGVNYIQCNMNTKCNEDFEVIVKADQFTKLINKTTVDEVELKIKDNMLLVKGNGTYKLEIFTEEDYPFYTSNISEVFKVRTKELIDAIQVGKNIKSETLSDGIMYSYLIRDGYLIATDSIKVCCTQLTGLQTEILIPPGIANLIETISDDTCELGIDEDKTEIMVKGTGVTIYGALSEGAEEFPDVTCLFEEPFNYSIDVNTKELIDAIDRLKLFITDYDMNLIDTVFTQDSLILSTLNGSVEVIPYIKPITEQIEIELSLNSIYLQNILKSIRKPTLNIQFGDTNEFIKFECEHKFILAVADGDDE